MSRKELHAIQGCTSDCRRIGCPDDAHEFCVYPKGCVDCRTYWKENPPPRRYFHEFGSTTKEEILNDIQRENVIAEQERHDYHEL